MMEWRKLEEGIQAQEQAGKLKIMEKTLSIHTMKEDTEKKMYEPIQKVSGGTAISRFRQTNSPKC
jgi:hypothetical protein